MRIKAHKVILSSVSPVFDNLFNGPWKDKNDPIKIDNMQPEVFKIFLRLLYGGKLEFDENFATIALHLLSLSSKYGIKDLGKSIVDYELSKNNNVIGIDINRSIVEANKNFKYL